MGASGATESSMTQPGDPSRPVTYSSCKPIRVEINTDGIDDEATAKQLVLSAMGEISAASHLQLVYVGPTERRPRYPDRPSRSSAARGPCSSRSPPAKRCLSWRERIGVGGSVPARVGGMLMYVTGQATLELGLRQ